MTNCHPLDTTKIVKPEFMCNLKDDKGRRVLRALNRGGTVSSLLRNQIDRLSPNAYVWVESRDKRWLITDGTQNFIIRNKHDNLKVYKRPIIDNCALEYHYFLEVSLPSEIDFPRYIQPPKPDIIVHQRDRQTQQLLQLSKLGIKLYCVDATVDWRLIVGLGGDHVLETNMTLHHIYGIPYIPGSAVKGVLRHWWLQEDFDNKEDKALKDKNFLDLFGSQKQRGKVQFLDAYPNSNVRLATDIMNPHYPNYYGGTEPPTDSQNPVPINFLTVEQTTFRFAFLAEDQRLLDKLKMRFEDALELKGIGAKTAVGYGYFRDFKEMDIIKREVEKQRKAERLLAEKQAEKQRLKKEETERQREAERLATLSPVEQLAEELKGLTKSQVDEARVTDIYNKELPVLEGDEKQMIARKLKAYWQCIKKWEGGSKKQQAKVQEVKSILGER